MRASSLVFLYRAIHLKHDPRAAYDSVTRIWVPHGPWKRLIETQLDLLKSIGNQNYGQLQADSANKVKGHAD